MGGGGGGVSAGVGAGVGVAGTGVGPATLGDGDAARFSRNVGGVFEGAGDECPGMASGAAHARAGMNMAMASAVHPKPPTQPRLTILRTPFHMIIGVTSAFPPGTPEELC